MSDGLSGESSRIALCVRRPRNGGLLGELLGDLFAEYDSVGVTESVPDDVDLCVVDEAGLDRAGRALTEWKRREQPTYAPVLLLTEARDHEAVWRRYDGSVGERLDAIQTVPAPKRAIRSQVEGLLQSRQYSITAQERREQLELYERALDGATVGITIADATDPNVPLVYANDEFCEITGYTVEEALGRNCRYLQGEETDPETIERIREALRTETSVSVDIRNYRKSGEPFWNSLEITPITDETGAVTHYLGFQRDVTTEKTQTLLLEQYERISQSVTDPIFVLDEDARVLYANDALERVFGVTADVVEGEPLTTLLDDSQAATYRATMEALAETGDPQRCELTLTDPRNQHHVFRFHLQSESLVSSPDTDRIVVVTQEVTSVREHQNRLSVLDRILRHNIRNKLNIVLAYATEVSCYANAFESDGLYDASTRIERAAMELLDLSEAAREFNQSIDPVADNTSTVDLAAVARQSVGDLRSRFPTATVDVDTPETARANCPTTISLCLAHLVENAVEHHDEAEQHVTVTVDAPADTDRVELRVSDDGPGIPETERQAFVRGSESPLEHSLGIGLWLVKWAVTSSRGRFSLEDNHPRGTTVTLAFTRPAETSPERPH